MIDKISKSIGVLLVSFFMCTNLAFASDYDSAPKTDDTYMYMDAFQQIFDTIRHDYVKRPDDKKLLEAAIKGMMKTLDPHSIYFTPKEYHAMMDSMDDHFTGIGAEVKLDKVSGLVEIVNPLKGSPALKAGLQPSDLIEAVDGKAVKGMTLYKAVGVIRGPSGSTVKLTIKRKDKTLTVSVVRGVIENVTVRSKMIGKNIGYVEVAQFNKGVSGQIKEALNTLQAKHKLKGLVLDLRGNPGGLLTEAANTVDLFVQQGLIVQTKERNPSYPHEEFYAETPVALPMDVPMVVLVDQYSASASEIVSSALRDLRKTKLVGVKSYGKGSVQQIYPLETGGGIQTIFWQSARFSRRGHL